MDDNGIVKVMEIIGDKVLQLESDLKLSEYVNNALKDENKNLREKLEAAEEKLARVNEYADKLDNLKE